MAADNKKGTEGKKSAQSNGTQGNSSGNRSGQMATLRKVLNYIRRYWLMVGLSLILAAVTVVLTLYVPILTGDAVDLLLGEGAVYFSGVFDLMKKIGIAMAVTALAQWVMNTCNKIGRAHV